jgi:hypothetical protein
MEAGTTTPESRDGEMGAGELPEPTELVYVSDPSWKPVFVAVGLALVLGGIFMGWILIVGGAILALLALWAWIANVRSDLARYPRRQRTTTAVIPATPLRTAARRSRQPD